MILRGDKVKIFFGGKELVPFDSSIEFNQPKDSRAIVPEQFCEECKDWFLVGHHGHFLVTLKRG